MTTATTTLAPLALAPLALAAALAAGRVAFGPADARAAGRRAAAASRDAVAAALRCARDVARSSGDARAVEAWRGVTVEAIRGVAEAAVEARLCDPRWSQRRDAAAASAARAMTGAEARWSATAAALLAAWKAAGLPWPSGGPCRVVPAFVVGFAGTATADVSTQRGWVDYSRRERHEALVDAEIRVRVRETWRSAVAARGLAVVDGLLTLDAVRDGAERGVEVYRARVASAGRGYAVVVEDAWIASSPAGAVHGATRQGALRAHTRRFGSAPAPSARQADEGAALTRAVAACLRAPHVVVRAADSHRAGNCALGTADWIARWFPGRASATVGEILDALGGRAQGDRARLALAACLAAIRAARREEAAAVAA